MGRQNRESSSTSIWWRRKWSGPWEVPWGEWCWALHLRRIFGRVGMEGPRIRLRLSVSRVLPCRATTTTIDADSKTGRNCCKDPHGAPHRPSEGSNVAFFLANNKQRYEPRHQ